MENHNKLLGRVAGVDGLKTGYTKSAGYCLSATAERNGRRIIGCVKWRDAVAGGQARAVEAGVADEFFQPGFETEAVDDEKIGAGELADIGGRGIVGMRIAAGREQTMGFDGVAADRADEVVEESIGGDNDGFGETERREQKKRDGDEAAKQK
jgi:hypothetical protein